MDARAIVVLVLSQIAWFACVLGGAAGLAWAGPAAVAVVLAAHLHGSSRRSADARFLVLAAGFGLLVDSALGYGGACAFDGGADGGWIAPAWMVALWPNFAVTLLGSLRALVARPLLAAAVGGIGGPLAYAAGVAFGALSLPAGEVVGLGAVAVAWAVALPGLALAARRIAAAAAPEVAHV